MPAAAKNVLTVALVVVLALLALAGGASGGYAGKRDDRSRDRQAPTMPGNLRVTASTATSVTVRWDPSTDNKGVRGYYVYVNGSRGTTSSTEYRAGRLDCGESVAIWVVAFDRAGNRSPRAETIASTAACPDTQPPLPPTGVRQDATAQDAVVLAWDPASDNVGVVGYGVYRSGLPVSWSPEPTVTLSGLSCASTYEYAVDAVDAAGNRSLRTPYWVVTADCADDEPPSTPTDLKLTERTTATLSLEWSPSTDNVGVEGYRLSVNGLPHVSVSAGETNLTTFALVGETASTVDQPRATLSGLACGTTYAVDVEAYDSAGNGSPPASLTAATEECAQVPEPPTPPAPDATPPSTPTGLAVVGATTTSVSLGWEASTDDVGVQGYGVYVNGASTQSVGQPGTTVSGLDCGLAYTFGIDAHDAAGNRSDTVTVGAATAACPQPPQPDTQPPAKPVLSLGARTETSLVLQWQPGSDNVGVHHYDVFRGLAPGPTNQTKVGETTALSYEFTGLNCATDYSLALEAVDAAGNKSVLEQAIWFPVRTLDCPAPQLPPPPSLDTTSPTQPGNLAVGASAATSVSLTWTSASDDVGVTGYGVYRNGNFVTTVSQPGATVSGLTCGTGYTFEVDAADAAGNRSTRAAVTSSTSACLDTQAPTVPANVTATSRTTTSIALSWSPSSDNIGVTGYGLYRAGALVGTATGTTGIFAGLACNANYTLSVDAYDAAGNRSTKSTVMVATTACPDTTAPSAPSGLAASSVTQTGLTLSWNASTDNVGVTGYDVYRNGTKVATVASTSSSQTGLACGTSYTFEVDAGDAAGNRSGRAVVTATTSACAPPPPPPSGAALAVSPSGSDATCVRGDLSRPCATFNKAYSIAECGDVIQIAGGTYTSQYIAEVSRLSNCASHVVFQEAAGQTATVSGRISLGTCGGCHSSNSPDAVTLRNLGWTDAIYMWGDADRVLVEGGDGGGMVLEGATNVTVRTTDFGPCNSSGPGTCQRVFILDHQVNATKTANVLFENNVVHDYRIVASGDHFECMFTQGGGTNVTIRGNRFYNCDTYGIATGVRDGVDYVNWKIENNWFGDTCCFGGLRGGGGRSRSSAIWINVNEDIVVRFNSFAPGQTIVTEGGTWFSNVRVVGNVLGSGGCVPGAVYSFNLTLGTACAATDRAVGQLPYVNSSADGAGDYHLTAGSLAESLVTSTSADASLSVDRDGDPRAALKDAGSDER